MARKRGTRRSTQPFQAAGPVDSNAALKERIAVLERECAQLEELLAADESWRALAAATAAEARGEAPPVPRAQLEAALDGNPLYRARCEILRAIEILRNKAVPADADTREPRPGEAAKDRPTIDALISMTARYIVGALAKSPPRRQAPVAFAQSPPADRLELIKGMDPDTAARLAAAGVVRFADIAGWNAADVARHARTLRLGKRIQREGWIAQAAVLAAGKTTHFARRAEAKAEMDGWLVKPPVTSYRRDPTLASRLQGGRQRAEGRPAPRPRGRRSIFAALKEIGRADWGTAGDRLGTADMVYDGAGTAEASGSGSMTKQIGEDAGSPAQQNAHAPDAPAPDPSETGDGRSDAVAGQSPRPADAAGREGLATAGIFREPEEAEVEIIERTPSFAEEPEETAGRRRHRPVRTGSLDARLRSATEPKALDARAYAGYRETIGEADVEIVRYDHRPREDDHRALSSASRGVRRLASLLRSLTGH